MVFGHFCCSVAICNNPKGHDIKYFKFPKDSKLRLKWIQACMRKDKFKLDHAYICSTHFLEEDYERDLRNELLNLPQRRRLKKDAIPSQHLGSTKLSELRLDELEQQESIEKKRNREMVKELLSKDYEVTAFQNSNTKKLALLPKPMVVNQEVETMISSLPSSTTISISPSVSRHSETIEDPKYSNEKSVQVDVRECHTYKRLESHTDKLSRTVAKQNEIIRFLKKKLKAQTSRVGPRKVAIAGESTPLTLVSDATLLSHKMDKRKIWTEEEIASCLFLKEISLPAYNFIRKNQLIQLPSLPTLQKFDQLTKKYQINSSGYVEKLSDTNMIETLEVENNFQVGDEPKILIQFQDFEQCESLDE